MEVEAADMAKLTQVEGGETWQFKTDASNHFGKSMQLWGGKGGLDFSMLHSDCHKFGS